MSVVIVTGSCGLVGSEAVRFYHALGYDVVGVDNDMRAYFFGPDASTAWVRESLVGALDRYSHVDADIRDADVMRRLFERHSGGITLVIHAAAQPSHDWAVREPITDFSVNAHGTLVILECTRRFAPEAAFIFTSTNKVYGDTPNRLPLIEEELRWEVDRSHPYFRGIDEQMSIDQSTHSLFGASKLAADVLVQEYGRYFGLKTACFRGGCLTGPSHSGAMLHGFLAYLAKCAITEREYTVFGYKAKQVRDNIHSADLLRAFHAFFEAPTPAAVYNIGGGRASHCSMLEAIAMCERITERPLHWTYQEQNRVGDHVWYVSDLARFQSHYPSWKVTYDCERILSEMVAENRERWLRAP